MTDYAKAQRAANARAIFGHPVFTEVLDELERAAIDACVYAKPQDAKIRAAYAAEVRAIRGLRAKFAGIIADADQSTRKPGIA